MFGFHQIYDFLSALLIFIILSTQNLAVIDETIDTNYIQHNSFISNCRKGLSDYVAGGSAPKNVTISITLADDNIVWTFRPDANVVDLWRVDNSKASNKIVEHWNIF
jgi:predicted SnoaL-like aldol condensation-catalyzing enzyme